MNPRWLLLAALMASSAHADPSDALSPASRELYLQARELEAQGDLDGAALRLRVVVRADPTFARAAVDLGRVLEASGDAPGAEAAYRSAPLDADAVEALGRLLLDEGRFEEATRTFRTLQRLAPESARGHRLEAEATAPSDPLAADALLRRWLGFPDVSWGPPARRTATAVVDALRFAGEGDAERALLEALVDRFPDAAGWADDRLDRYRIRDEARRLAGAAPQALTASQAERLAAARAAFAAGDLDRADALLTALRDEAPRNPDTWAALSDVREAQGDVGGAEQAVQWALALAPLEPRFHARLGDLLAAHYAGRFDEDAARAYAAALRLAPTRAELHVRRARVLARAGDRAGADTSFRRYLALDPRGPHADEARRAVADLWRERPEPPEVPPSPGRPASVPEDAWWAYWHAQVHYGRNDLDAAVDALATARRLAPDFLDALNLEADIELARGATSRARSLYEQSLRADPRQPRVLSALGEQYRREGRDDDAVALWERAAALGAEDARYRLARHAFARWRLMEADAHLDAYFEGATSGAHHDDARALRSEVRSWLLRAKLALGGVGLGVVLLPVARAWRRRSGVGLDALLDRAPGEHRDVARIASAVRHEVLKHNTTVLPSVADALDDRDTAPARWAAERLFHERGAVARFRSHVRELERLGRVHGVRLNLRHADPAFGPLVRGMDRLEALRGELERGAGRRLADELRDVSRLLNHDGYRGLGRLIRDLCLLRVDEGVVSEAWAMVAREPAFRDAPLPEPVIEVEAPSHVRVFRDELLDILANVLRNALQATLDAGDGRIGVRVRIEEDDVTFLERVAIRVADDAPRRISTAVIRGRYIERGLGLTVDLISRNGGSIHVEDEPGFTKAVVVRLPLAEVADEEDET